MNRSDDKVFGFAAGALVAPALAALSFFRRARVFHPDGHVYRAEVTALRPAGPDASANAEVAALGDRLAGGAILRFSGGAYKEVGAREPADILGCAVRFTRAETPTAAPSESDQDLLTASFESLALVRARMRTTHQHDYLANDYYAVQPYEVSGLGRAKFRLVAERVSFESSPTLTRAQRLDEAVARCAASLRVEIQRGRGAPWEPVCGMRVIGRAEIDQRALRFSPFRAGRGLEPTGFLAGIRRVAYPASVVGRSLVGR